MNIDSLQALIDYYFPMSGPTVDLASFLYRNINDSNLTIKDVVNNINEMGDDIYLYVDRWFAIINKEDELADAGTLLHIILCINNDDYWAGISERLLPVFVEFIEEVRSLLRD